MSIGWAKAAKGSSYEYTEPPGGLFCFFCVFCFKVGEKEELFFLDPDCRATHPPVGETVQQPTCIRNNRCPSFGLCDILHGQFSCPTLPMTPAQDTATLATIYPLTP